MYKISELQDFFSTFAAESSACDSLFKILCAKASVLIVYSHNTRANNKRLICVRANVTMLASNNMAVVLLACKMYYAMPVITISVLRRRYPVKCVGNILSTCYTVKPCILKVWSRPLAPVCILILWPLDAETEPFRFLYDLTSAARKIINSWPVICSQMCTEFPSALKPLFVVINRRIYYSPFSVFLRQSDKNWNSLEALAGDDLLLWHIVLWDEVGKKLSVSFSIFICQFVWFYPMANSSFSHILIWASLTLKKKNH